MIDAGNKPVPRRKAGPILQPPGGGKVDPGLRRETDLSWAAYLNGPILR
jgi:hypothetical protein